MMSFSGCKKDKNSNVYVSKSITIAGLSTFDGYGIEVFIYSANNLYMAVATGIGDRPTIQGDKVTISLYDVITAARWMGQGDFVIQLQLWAPGAVYPDRYYYTGGADVSGNLAWDEFFAHPIKYSIANADTEISFAKFRQDDSVR